MKRIYKAVLLIAVLLILAGCAAPYFEPPDPYPYSFTDSNKQPYPRTTAGAQRFIADSRPPRWKSEENNVVYAPIVSARRLRGDCDDFAVMIAYYLQEYWDYDTFIVFLDMGTGRDDHAIAFVHETDGLISDYYDYCQYRPTIVWYNSTYYPVDWTYCPDWMWRKYGGTVDYFYGGWTYDVTTREYKYFRRGQYVEWYEMVNLALDYGAERTPLPAREPAEVSNAGI